MKSRIFILLLLVVMPGFSASAVCAYYLIPEWATLTASYQNYRRVSESPSATEKEILIAKTAQEIHRINCFAEGGIAFRWNNCIYWHSGNLHFTPETSR